VVLTDGEGSHPCSPTCSPDELAQRRREESRVAARSLGEDIVLHRAGLPDGGLDALVEAVTTLVVDVLGDARDVLLVAPWRRDGHPDHEAAGRAAAASALRTGARLLEYPIWFWHWGDPADAPWPLFAAVGVDAGPAARKRAAISAHRTQVAPLSDAPGDEVLLTVDFLDHFAGDEVFVLEPVSDQTFDQLHVDRADPWRVEESFYERRKRDLTLAALPRRHFRRGLELGCSRGALAHDLAARCDVLVAVDRSPEAVTSARERVPRNVDVRLVDVPSSWPEGHFDLVVLSEVGYFLSPRDLEHLLERIRDCLTADGVVVLCHWRHEVVGWVLDGPEVHAQATDAGLPPVSARYRDRDVELLVLADDVDWPRPDA
ncbi:MAG: SAM-dependent methyltransferase, partial [Nocardioides sp.]